MRKLFTLAILLSVLLVNAQPKQYSVANAHSHNDYEQPVPFWTAYNESFGSIEADIFLVHDSLIVAHDIKEFSLQRTLEQYYLEPLDSCVKKNKGHVFADKKRQLQLMIDIKSDATATLNKLIETLQKYPSLINNRSLKFVISGNRPDEGQFNSYPSFILFDGILSKEYTPAAMKKIAMLSDNIRNYVHGNNPTDVELQTMRAAIKKAHALKKPVRYWGTPDDMDTWKKQMSLQVDYINTDHITELSKFLQGR